MSLLNPKRYETFFYTLKFKREKYFQAKEKVRIKIYIQERKSEYTELNIFLHIV